MCDLKMSKTTTTDDLLPMEMFNTAIAMDKHGIRSVKHGIRSVGTKIHICGEEAGYKALTTLTPKGLGINPS